MDAKEAMTYLPTAVVTYVGLGLFDAVYLRFACDANNDGKNTRAEYDTKAASGVHRLFGPIHGIMATVFNTVWPFDEVDPENA